MIVDTTMSAEQLLTRKVSRDQIKILQSDHRPEAEVNQLILLVDTDVVRLQWGEADRARRWLCSKFSVNGIPEPVVARAGIAKAF